MTTELIKCYKLKQLDIIHKLIGFLRVVSLYIQYSWIRLTYAEHNIRNSLHIYPIIYGMTLCIASFQVRNLSYQGEIFTCSIKINIFFQYMKEGECVHIDK